MQLRPRADVDARGRVIEDQETQGRPQRPPDDHLLLVAAAQRAQRTLAAVVRPNGEAGGQLTRRGALAPRTAQEAILLPTGTARGEQVLAHGEIEDRALGLPVAGDVGAPRLGQSVRMSERQSLAVQRRPAGAGSGSATQESRQLPGSAADQPADGDDLARRDVEVDRLVQTGTEQSADAQAITAIAVAAVAHDRLALDDGVADDRLDHRGVRGARHIRVQHPPAVAQDGEAVGQVVDLAQTVGDVDEGHARLTCCLQRLAEPLDLGGGQARADLVKHDHARVEGECARHGHHHLLVLGQLADHAARVDRAAELGQDRRLRDARWRGKRSAAPRVS